MGILKWGKPDQVMPVEDWRSISADGAPEGVFVVNASEEDQMGWWAELSGQRKPPLKVTIKHTTSDRRHVRMVIKVYENGDVEMSANGTARLTALEYVQMDWVVLEAARRIVEYREEHGIKTIRSGGGDE